MKKTKNILTEKEMELVELLMADCQSTGDIQAKLLERVVGRKIRLSFGKLAQHSMKPSDSVRVLSMFLRKRAVANHFYGFATAPRLAWTFLAESSRLRSCRNPPLAL